MLIVRQIVRSKWHVPVQVFGTVVAVVAYFLGHLHRGRVFAPNVHASFSNALMLMLAVQIVFGIYLKFHITKGFHGKIRKLRYTDTVLSERQCQLRLGYKWCLVESLLWVTAEGIILDNVLHILSWAARSSAMELS